jgi:VWFA-related protein
MNTDGLLIDLRVLRYLLPDQSPSEAARTTLRQNMKNRPAFLLALLGALLLAPVATAAQAASAGPSSEAKPQSPAQAKAGDANRAVTLDVVVTDKSGKPVPGLKVQDFMVLDNKAPRDILSFHEAEEASANADPPVEVYLLVDMINLGFVSSADERRNIAEYLKGSGGHLAVPTSFIFLTDTGLKFQKQPTQDANILLANLESNPTSQSASRDASGYNGVAQRREKSLQALDVLAVNLSKKPGRKLVIWLSPGWAAFSHATNQKTRAELQVLFNYIVAVSTVLTEARITLYSVDPLGASYINKDNFYYKDFLKGVAFPKDGDNADLMLQVLATQTGGKVVFGSNDTASMINECLADAGAFYVLTYNAPPATHTNEYHGIEVKVDNPGLKARTRTGYYAQP